ncbi:hypothetical protein [Aestuariivirga sp.]|uniref:hypothetical protein n=1 Tax=Aestuariivirga sp. TaxID=2650926 RepID=UPI0039E67047
MTQRIRTALILMIVALSETIPALADDCRFETRNEMKQSFWWVHLVSHCEEKITLQSISLNGRAECTLSVNRDMRLGDDYVFGIATTPDEALNMQIVGKIAGLQYFDTTNCGEPVRLELQTSIGTITLE